MCMNIYIYVYIIDIHIHHIYYIDIDIIYIHIIYIYIPNHIFFNHSFIDGGRLSSAFPIVNCAEITI